jgi:hypothetical protein
LEQAGTQSDTAWMPSSSSTISSVAATPSEGDLGEASIIGPNAGLLGGIRLWDQAS